MPLGYNGYTKGSRYETDRMVRDEIARAAGRVRSHMQNVFDNEFKNGNSKLPGLQNSAWKSVIILWRMSKKLLQEWNMHSFQVKDRLLTKTQRN